jgi:hypothetical protein
VAGERGRERVGDVGGFEHGPGGDRDRQPRVVVDDVEDLHAAAVGELPVGEVGLPAFVGLIGFEPDQRRLRFLAGCGVTNPRRVSTRQIVETEGAVPCLRSRCHAIVTAPASHPCSDSSLRNRTMRSSTFRLVCRRLDRGALERGASPASPSCW